MTTTQTDTVQPPQPGDLRVWWIPQVPMSAFTVPVESAEQGHWLCNVLADYDQFQLDNNIKPEYFNAGGVNRYEDNGDGGFDWYDLDEDDSDEDDSDV